MYDIHTPSPIFDVTNEIGIDWPFFIFGHVGRVLRPISFWYAWCSWCPWAYPVGLISIQYFMMLVGRGHSDVDYFLDSSFHSVFPPTYPGLCHISVELWEPLVWSGRGGSRWKPWGPYFENGETTFLFQLYRKSWKITFTLRHPISWRLWEKNLRGMKLVGIELHEADRLCTVLLPNYGWKVSAWPKRLK